MRHIFKILYLAAANFLVITSASPPPVFELFDTLPTTSHPRTKEEKAFWLLEQQRHFLQDLVPFVQNPSADALPPLLITSAAITTQVHDIDLATINNTSGLLEKLAMEWMKTYLEKHDAIVKKNLVNNNTTRNISNQLMIQRRSPRARPVESSSKNNPVKVNDHTDRALNPIIHVNDLHRPEAPAEVYNTVKYHAAYSAAAYCNFGLSTWNCGARCKATQGNKIVKKLSSILTDTTGFVSGEDSQAIDTMICLHFHEY